MEFAQSINDNVQTIFCISLQQICQEYINSIDADLLSDLGAN